MAPFTFSETDAGWLAHYLPKLSSTTAAATIKVGKSDDLDGHAGNGLPFVTLSFASSLESAVTLNPGRTTAISGPASLAMTHFLRSRHDAILIGVNTLLGDNPSLNCRLAGHDGTSRPPRLRPVIIDPSFRCRLDSDTKVIRLAQDGQGLAPYVVVAAPPPPTAHATVTLLQSLGGKIILVAPVVGAGPRPRLRWRDVLQALAVEGVRSVMVEGGATVISSMLGPEGSGCVDVVIVTVAPKWFGTGSLLVAPPRAFDSVTGVAVPALELADVRWHQLGHDVVLCGRPPKADPFTRSPSRRPSSRSPIRRPYSRSPVRR